MIHASDATRMTNEAIHKDNKEKFEKIEKNIIKTAQMGERAIEIITTDEQYYKDIVRTMTAAGYSVTFFTCEGAQGRRYHIAIRWE